MQHGLSKVPSPEIPPRTRSRLLCYRHLAESLHRSGLLWLVWSPHQSKGDQGPPKLQPLHSSMGRGLLAQSPALLFHAPPASVPSCVSVPPSPPHSLGYFQLRPSARCLHQLGLNRCEDAMPAEKHHCHLGCWRVLGPWNAGPWCWPLCLPKLRSFLPQGPSESHPHRPSQDAVTGRSTGH